MKTPHSHAREVSCNFDGERRKGRTQRSINTWLRETLDFLERAGRNEGSRGGG